MHGSAAIFAWMLGAVLAYTDGLVWAELGAKYPEAGGSYVFLQNLYGAKWGKLFAFLFIWQTLIQAPLVIASGAIGFSDYFSFLVPLTVIQKKMVSGTLIIFLVTLLYRNIKSVGKISVVLFIVTASVILWLIGSGFMGFHSSLAFDMNLGAFGGSNTLLFAALGPATLNTVYSYLGYYNVCHLGGEIKEPQKNIPRSILISITGIAMLYMGMQIMVSGALPREQIAASTHVVSDYFEHLYASHMVGVAATCMILFIALAALFSGILGYSRIPYAAALKGDFFKVFARVHPKHQFPHISLLFIGILAFIFSLYFKLVDVIKTILMMRILIQFVSQSVGLIMWHIRKPKDERPFKMPLFPIPALVSIAIWLYIYFTTDSKFIWYSLIVIGSGLVLFLIRYLYQKQKEQPVTINK